MALGSPGHTTLHAAASRQPTPAPPGRSARAIPRCFLGGAALLIALAPVEPARAQFCGVLDQNPGILALGDTLGASVAIDGEWALAGDPIDDFGAQRNTVVVYRRDAGGANAWGRVQLLSQLGALGYAVDLSGTTALAAAPGAESPGADPFAGSVWVYEPDVASQWQPTAQLWAIPPVAYDQFGYVLTLDGDTAAIASVSQVSVRERDAAGPDSWGEVTSFQPGGLGGYLQRLDLHGDTLAAGNVDVGVVEIRERNQGGPDQWGVVQTLTAPGPGSFGASVALWGDVLAVTHFQGGVGEVRVHRRDAGGADAWGEVALLPAPPERAQDFGLHLSLRGKRLLVWGTGTAGDGVHRYHEDAGGPGAWGLVDVLVPPSPPISPVGPFFVDVHPIAQTLDTILLGATVYSQFDAEFGSNGAAIFFTPDCFEPLPGPSVPALGAAGLAATAAALALAATLQLARARRPLGVGRSA
jgi:hypothetical protein